MDGRRKLDPTNDYLQFHERSSCKCNCNYVRVIFSNRRCGEFPAPYARQLKV